MMLQSNEASGTDRRMAAAWPAPEVATMRGWLVRSNGGTTRRANSALAFAGDETWDEHRLGAATREVEAFYIERDQRPIVLASTASAPPLLPNFLMKQGWTESALTDVMRGSVRHEPTADTASNHAVTVSTVLDDVWFDLFWSTMIRTDVEQDAYRMLIGGAENSLFAIIPGAGVGQAAVVEGVGVVQCMATVEAERGKGVAGAILHSLATELCRLKVDEMELAVMRANTGARRLYERAGFTTAHTYSYLAAPA